MQKNRNRLLIFFLIITLLVIALTGRLVFIQVYWSEELTALARDQQNKNIVEKARRGDIIDRNGDKMAFSVKTFSVWVNASTIKKVDETATLIAETLDIAANPLIQAINNATTTHVKIVSDLTKSEADLLRSKGIRGITIAEETKRIYPYGSLASHVLGNVNVDDDGFLGLELYYNAFLKGTPGEYYITTDVHGRQLAYGEEEITAAVNGSTVQLTIDDTIQYFVEQRLQEAMIEFEAKQISVVIMDPYTGEILSMASKPDFNLNSPRDPGESMEQELWNDMTLDERMNYLNQMWRNPVISNTYEPGSTFKAITSAIAIEEKVATVDTETVCNGIHYVNGVPLRCWNYPRSHGHQTFIQAFANSCNPSYIQIGSKIGADTFYEYMEAFGLMDKTGIDLPAESSSITVPLSRVGPIELATLSYGHGLNVTMLQMVTAVSALVNGGELMTPYLVKGIYDASGEAIVETQPSVVRRVISQATSETMKDMLRYAATSGGRRVFIDGIDIGGKSGTSTKFVDGAYQDDKVVSSYVAVVPLEKPQFVILVTVDEPKDETLGSIVASPIAKAIIQDILRYWNIVPDSAEGEKIVVPDVKHILLGEAVELLEKVGLKYATEPIGITSDEAIVLDQFPKAGVQVTKETIIILSVKE